MRLHARSRDALLRRTATGALLCLLTALAEARAQTTWKVDQKGSLAWWQIDPHLNHLWATTCPEEPTWRPGEGRSGGWTLEGATAMVGRGFAAVSDTIHVPLYPRRRARLICSEAVQGQFVLPDTVRWSGAEGQISVDPNMLVTGEAMRDVYMHDVVLQSRSFPEIRFTLDSLADMSRRADTLRGTAMGTLLLRGMTKPVSADFQAYPQAGGTRVLGKFRIPVRSLLTEFGVSKSALGLGVMTDIWKTLFMGVDLLVRPETEAR